jgi:hypothetical protein
MHVREQTKDFLNHKNFMQQVNFSDAIATRTCDAKWSKPANEVGHRIQNDDIEI